MAKELTIEQAERLAKEHLGIDTLEAQNSDSSDFHEVAVWQVRDLIFAAFEAGKQAK